MTFWDFLAQAGFWQWFGIIVMAAAILDGISGIITAWRKP